MSKYTPIFFAKAKKGQLEFDNLKLFSQYLIALDGKIVQVVVKIPQKPRTRRQNRYYWSCVVSIPAEHFGYLPEEMHDAYKLLFLRMHEEGKPETIKSTTQLSTKEFNEYIEQCRQWAAEQGLVIPDPKEVEL